MIVRHKGTGALMRAVEMRGVFVFGGSRFGAGDVVLLGAVREVVTADDFAWFYNVIDDPTPAQRKAAA